jgi:hypothetical protein
LSLILKNGHVEYKTGFCSHCGESFQYPTHQKPRPTYCADHDPAELEPIDLSQFTGAVTPGAPAVDPVPQPVATSGYIQVLDHDALRTSAVSVLQYTIGTPGQHPVGNHFVDSPGMRSVEDIRSEYMARIARVQAPESIELALPSPKKGSTIGITHMGDIHIGTDACTYSAFKQMLDWILYNPDEYLAIQGDMAEQSLTIHDQFVLATADLMPLAKARKILWMLRGNHEERQDKATKNIVDGAQQMARHLDVRYLGVQGYVKVVCNGLSYLSYNIHGFSAGRRPGSRRNKMEDMLHRHPTVDVMTCGHNHHLDVLPFEVEEFRDSRPYARMRWGIYTGTYHSYMGYAADAGLGAGPLGCARIRFDVSDGHLMPEILPVVRYGTGYIHKLPRV